MSNNPVIPEAAAEAAMSALCEAWVTDASSEQLNTMVRHILESAAPSMLAAAWDDGIMAGIRCDGTNNPYR